jgi:retinol dehydrogenase-12
MFLLDFVRSQLFVKLPIPDYDFSGQTIIVTGGSSGLGFEAAQLLLQLNASNVILAVRSTSRGRQVAEKLQASIGRADSVEVYSLEMEQYESVIGFAADMGKRDRVDAVILNAGKATLDFYLAEGNESTVTVNVLSTFLLAYQLLPVLRKSAVQWGIIPRISIVSSDMHNLAKLRMPKSGSIFDELNNEFETNMTMR